jgi:ribosomal protein S27AE
LHEVKLKTDACPVCGAHFVKQTHGYWECEGCGYSLCPPEETERQARKIILDCARNDSVSNPTISIKKHSGGGKSGKRHGDRKAKMQRPSTTQIYNRLVDK